MAYLWIGLGGALGSIARAWMAAAVARLTGPAFPWGTILINILGSFVIGFFGTLTASGTRFSVPADMRAFVMVGICGGFTTFSSFSLQTLDLARDGRVLQAGGNVALSLVLCLLSVTAGYAAAAAVHGPQPAPAFSKAKTMGEVVVAVLNEPDRAQSLLSAGTRLLEISGGGRLKALAVRLPAAASVLPSEEVLTADREAAFRAERENWADQSRRLVADWMPEAQRHGVETEWLDLEGDAVGIVTDHGRRADAIVIARPAAHETERMHDCLHAALFESGSPVLVAPPDFPGRFGQVIAIAWKDDERAAEAVRSALPLLRQAQAVHVLCARDPAVLPPTLAEHGIEAVLHRVEEGQGSVGRRLLGAAHGVGADLLVMGAFAHGEWRQRLFGGVTRTMLAEADLPLWMRH